jgi:SNF2 family DNA or RNA helicase
VRVMIVRAHGGGTHREMDLRAAQRFGGVCLTTYGLVSTSHEQLSGFEQPGTAWDLVILDEGHKIRNHTTKVSQAVSDSTCPRPRRRGSR